MSMKALVLSLALALFAFGATPLKGPVYIPNTATPVTSSTVSISSIVLVNNSSGAVTVNVTDQSTNCNSGVCHAVPVNLSIAANTSYLYGFPDGWPATGGIIWSASSSNAVEGTIYIK